MNKRIPVIVISGFLGSGKTTFLRYLLRESNKKFGLIINEFGDVGIDGDLVKSCNGCDDSAEDCIIELNNGCLCCTVQDDFIPSIKSLLNFNPDIEAIIIETSGLALPLPLIQALNWPEIRTSIYLDLVIGIVNGESMLKGSPINDLNEITNQYDELNKIDHNASIDELFEEQLEVSDIVLISRADVLNEKEFKSIKNIIKEKFNSTVPIIKSLNGKIDLEYILSIYDSYNLDIYCISKICLDMQNSKNKIRFGYFGTLHNDNIYNLFFKNFNDDISKYEEIDVYIRS